MSFQPTVDTLDAIDESLRGAYVENAEGKFDFDLSKYNEIVKAPLVNKNKELLDWKAKNKAYVERGTKYADLTDEEYEEYRQFKEAKANGGHQQQPDDKGKLQQTIREATEKVKKDYQAQLEAANAKLADAEQRFRTTTIKTLLTPELLAANAHSDSRLPVGIGKWMSRFELEGDKLIFLEADGQTPSHLSVAEAIKTVIFKEDPWLEKASEKGGSGAPPNGGRSSASSGNKSVTRAAFNAMNPRQQMEFSVAGGTITDG